LAGLLDDTAPLELESLKRRPEAWETRLDESLIWLVQHEALTAEDADTVRRSESHALELMADVTSRLLGDGQAVKVNCS